MNTCFSSTRAFVSGRNERRYMTRGRVEHNSNNLTAGKMEEPEENPVCRGIRTAAPDVTDLKASDSQVEMPDGQMGKIAYGGVLIDNWK